MSKISRLAGIGLLSAGLLAGSATAAFAGGTPTPPPTPAPQSTCPTVAPATPTYGSPTVSPQFGYNPCPTPEPRNPCPVVLAPVPLAVPVGTDYRLCPQVRQQEFDITDTFFNGFRPSQRVLGTGPIRFAPINGSDVTVSSTLDRFRDRFGDSVLVHHAALGGASVDLRTCSIQLAQTDLPFWIRGGGTGIDRRAISAGVYDLSGIFSFPTRDFRCTLPVGLTATQAAYDLNNNGSGLPTPLMGNVSVQATGWSLVVPRLSRYGR